MSANISSVAASSGRISVHIVALAAARQPIAVKLNDSQILRVTASAPMMISVPPPKSDPNQKTTPPSPEVAAR